MLARRLTADEDLGKMGTSAQEIGRCVLVRIQHVLLTRRGKVWEQDTIEEVLDKKDALLNKLLAKCLQAEHEPMRDVYEHVDLLRHIWQSDNEERAERGI